MKAILMAGGEGQRLRPLTCALPKPMVPMLGRPVMSYAVELLRAHGVREIGATVQYLGDHIESYFKDGSDFSVHMRYYREESPLGTAGSVKAASDFLDETFYVVSGDALSDVDLSEALRFHRARGAIATLVLKRVPRPLEYGVVMTDGDGRILRFLEKPGWGEVFSDTVNTGIYILEPEALAHVPEGAYDFGKQLFPELVRAGAPVYGYVMEGYWCDVGDIQSYLGAHKDCLDGKVAIDWGQDEASGLILSKGAHIEPGAVVEGPCLIGPQTVVKAGAHIGPYSVIGGGCRIAEGVSIKRAVLWRSVSVGSRTQVRGAVLCDEARVGANAALFEGAVVAQGASLGERSILMPGVRVWPHKRIESGLTVERNVIWGAKEAPIFRESGICQPGGEWTPEQAVQLGCAVAQATGWTTMTVGGDDTPAGRMIQNAIMAGLTACGVQVRDVSGCAPQVLRYAITALGMDGGAFVSPKDGYLVDIYDRLGATLDQDMRRRVEGACARLDHPYMPPERVGRVSIMRDVELFYKRELLAMVDEKRIRQAEIECTLTFDSPAVMALLRDLLETVGCRVTLQRDAARKPGTGVTFHLPADGETLGVAVDGQWMHSSVLPALFSQVSAARMPRSPFHVPIDSAMAVDSLALRTGCTVTRMRPARQARMSALLSGDTSAQLWARLSFDAVASALLLVDAAARKGMTLEAFVSQVPGAHVREVRVPCRDADKGRILRTLYPDGDASDLGGVRIVGERGWSLVLPSSDAAECRVIVEGLSAEFADELTDLTVKRVRDAAQAPSED